jgi:hypothetical protein
MMMVVVAVAADPLAVLIKRKTHKIHYLREAIEKK